MPAKIMTDCDAPDVLSPEELNAVLGSIDIPVCPAIVLQVMAEAQKDEPDLKELGLRISADVGMAAQVIKLANSPLFRAGAPVTSVPQALSRLGTQNVVCVVVGAALRSSVKGVPAALLEAFWHRATVNAMAAGLIARRHYGIPPDMAYTYALFHDAAIPVMMRRFPSYGSVIATALAGGQGLIKAESDNFNCTHPVVGAMLVHNWGLPPAIRQAVRNHHEPAVYDLPHTEISSIGLTMVAVTHVAEHLVADILGETDLEVGTALFQRALKHLGIHDTDLEELREDLQRSLNDILV